MTHVPAMIIGLLAVFADLARQERGAIRFRWGVALFTVVGGLAVSLLWMGGVLPGSDGKPALGGVLGAAIAAVASFPIGDIYKRKRQVRLFESYPQIYERLKRLGDGAKMAAFETRLQNILDGLVA